MGKVACLKGKRTLFYRMQDMLLHRDYATEKEVPEKLANYDLLIIDKWLGDPLNEK